MSLRCFLVLLTLVCLLSPGTCVYSQITLPKSEDKVLGTISGRVTLDDGSPAVGFTVYATPQWFRGMHPDPVDWNHAVTDQDGRYSFVLHPSKYNFLSGPIRLLNDTSIYVAVLNGGKPYIEPDALRVDPVKAQNHAVTNADFVLRLGPQIIVHAHDAITHAPVAGLKIRLEGQSTSEPSVDGVTGTDGTFATRLTYTDIEMRADFPEQGPPIGAFAPGYGQSRESYQRVKVEPGKDLNWEIKTYGMTDKSDWHGVVLGPGGKPAAGITVRINGVNIAGPVTFTTDAQGRFSAILPRLEYYQDGQGPLITAQQGDLVAGLRMTPDQTWDGVTLKLAPGATVSGVLVDPQGRPASGANVALDGSVFDDSSSGIGPFQGVRSFNNPFLPVTVTDPQGRFTLRGLLPGSYRIDIYGGGWGDLAYPASIMNPAVQQPVFPLTAQQNHDVGRLTDPPANQVLAGTAVDSSGKLWPQGTVRVEGDHTHQIAGIQNDGSFHVYDVVREPLTLTVGSESNPDITLPVPVGQQNLRLVVPGAAPPPIVIGPPAKPKPSVQTAVLTPPPSLGPIGGTIEIDRLALDISTDTDGVVSVRILRPNLIDHSSLETSVFMDKSIPILWHGHLEDLQGMHLTIKDNHGTLTDRSGKSLWSGIVVDPPEDTIICRPHRGKKDYSAEISVRNAQGKTIWTGIGLPYEQMLYNDCIHIISPNHTVAWERGVGSSRVAVRSDGVDWIYDSDWKPVDVSFTLHLTTLKTTVRDAQGNIVWTGGVPALQTDLHGFPVEPSPGPNGKLTDAQQDWIAQRRSIPGDFQTLPYLSNVPHKPIYAFTDAQGKSLPTASVRYVYSEAPG